MDTTDTGKWHEQVFGKARQIIESFIDGLPSSHQPLTGTVDEETKSDTNSTNYCEVCKRIFIGDRVYKIHLNSFKHKKVLKRNNMLEKATNTEDKKVETE